MTKSISKPGTIDHFRAWARNLVLDTGELWEPEDFQLAVVEDILAGTPSVWMVVPEGNGKTTLWSGIGLYHGDSEGWNIPSPSVPIGASSREQAEILYRQAEGFVIRTPGMRKRFHCQEGYRRIKCLSTDGRIQVYAADARTGDGVIPSLALIDELHRHKDLRLYRTWRGKLDKRAGQIAVISTAGEPMSDFELTRAAILDQATKKTENGAYIRAEGGGVVLHDYALRDEKQAGDLDAVAAANPRKAITAEVLKAKRSDPTLTDPHWLRFTCNVASETEESWIAPSEWDACQGEVELTPDTETFIGVDIGQVHDSSAVLRAGWVDGKLHVECRVWTPKPNQPIQVRTVEAHVVDLAETTVLEEVAYDPARFNRSAEILEERSIRMVEFPQTDSRMNEASNTLLGLIREGKIVHDGDPILRAHVLSGVAAETDRGWRISKKRSKTRHIDALVALAMAAQRATVGLKPNRPFIEVVA